MSVVVSVEGLSDLEASLLELSKSAGKAVLRRVGRKALQPVDDAWRPIVRRRTGKLAESGGVGSKLSRRQRQAVERESSIEVFAGPGPLVQAITEEFGTLHEAAHPFLRPAWEATKEQVLEIVKNELGGEIAKTAARAERKAARLAAKIAAGG